MPQTATAPPRHLPIAVQSGAIAPLRGVTVLAVEDSRHSSEVLRLICQRLGARLRRAETLRAAESHLRTYRPDVVIIDLGLPDGSGLHLIRSLALRSTGKRSVILATSGQPEGRSMALAAGAQGFLDKPFPPVAQVLSLLLGHLPDRQEHTPPTSPAPIIPDPMALRDDILAAADQLARNPPPDKRRYLLAHLAGLAQATGDAALSAQVRDVQRGADLAPLVLHLHHQAGPVVWA